MLMDRFHGDEKQKLFSHVKKWDQAVRLDL